MPTLFQIETEAAQLVWSGDVKPTSVGAALHTRPFGLRVARLDDGPRPRVRVSKRVRALPEETPFTLYLRSRDGSSVTLQHDDPVLLSRLQQPAPDVLHGPLRFGSQVGRSRFTVLVDGVPHLRFEVEIVPTKLDYRRDYRALVRDVTAMADDLALQHVAAAFHRGDVLAEPGRGRSEVALLAALADGLDAALHRALRQPLRSLVGQRKSLATHRATRPDAALIRRLNRSAAPSSMLEVHTAAWTLDTPEHRWLAVALHRLDARLARRLALPARTARDEAAQIHLAQLRRRVDRWRALPPLAAATRQGLPVATLRLARAPGYREAARTLRLLHQRFSLGPGALPFRLRDLHRLYEFACLLWIVRALAQATGHHPAPDDLLETDASGLDLRLRTGRHRLAFPLPDGGRIVLRYVPRLAAPGAILPQRPDFLLTRLTPGQPPRRYVLDAKYRLDASAGAVRRFGHPAPPPAALGVLHRYRDAIVEHGTQGAQRRVAQAVVLYPWHDDGRYETGRLARSLDTIGVGAIPVLPGATHLLERWIHAVVIAAPSG